MKKLYLLLIFSICFCAVKAQKVYDFNATCQNAYQEITKLKLDNGQKLIDEARKQNPNNLIPDMLEGYIDFFILFFNEDPNEYKARKANFDRRLDIFEAGPENTPFYRFAKASTYLQRACIRIKFGERYGAGWDAKKANAYIKDNYKKYPWFQPNLLVLGPLQVGIGTIPKGYRWITSLLGMKGSIKGGMQIMRNFLTSNDPYAKLYANEGIFYYCYLMFYIENKPDEVFKFIQSKNIDLVNNHLFAYLAANLGINNKRTDFASSIITSRNQSSSYLKTPVWDFEMGYIKLHKLELDEAIGYFGKFIKDFKGNFYVKDALQKMSWAYYLQGNQGKAEEYRQLTLQKGNTDTDADKKAYRDAKNGTWHNKTLLKARILNDGGFNQEALNVLKGKTTDDFPSAEEALEFAYRTARIYDDLEKDDLAIQYYQKAIQLGRNREEYYAARAALQIGFIYEKRGQNALAIKAFEQCLDMEDHEYKDSLDQRAKSGIARCKGE